MAGSAPLHKTVHWRRLKTIINIISRYEKIDLSKYDTDNITIREDISGTLLHGKNVSYDIHDKSRSYFVTDNRYDIYEIPAKSNTNKLYGKYLLLIYNRSYKYWMFGKMETRIDKKLSLETKQIVDSYFYDILGHYNITSSGRYISFDKYRDGNHIAFGNAETGIYCTGFDRKNAYGYTNNMILNDLGYRNTNKDIANGNIVKVYRKYKSKKKKK